jgi:hypothetical protein
MYVLLEIWRFDSLICSKSTLHARAEWSLNVLSLLWINGRQLCSVAWSIGFMEAKREVKDLHVDLVLEPGIFESATAWEKMKQVGRDLSLSPCISLPLQRSINILHPFVLKPGW